jgi:hypothetical protein
MGRTAGYTLFSNKIYEDIIQKLQTLLITGCVRNKKEHVERMSSAGRIHVQNDNIPTERRKTFKSGKFAG